MKSSELLSCILFLVTEGIFCRCEGRLNSSSSATFSRKTSFTPSPSWTSLCLRSLSSTSATQNNPSNVISPNRTSMAATKYTSATVTTEASVSPTSKSVGTQAVQPGLPPSPQLTSFGIFLLTFGGVLVVFMMFSLIWICCRGREKSPQAPHTQVKLKPWSRTRNQSLNDVTTTESDHPTSYQNQGLNSSNLNSPLGGNSNAVTGKVENIRESQLI